MSDEKTTYIIEIKQEFCQPSWVRLRFGLYASVKDVRDFMEKFWPATTYRVMKETREIVFYSGIYGEKGDGRV